MATFISRPRRLRELTPAGRHLVQLMQRLNFGRIENLVVRDGDPVLTPAPELVREVKFGGDNGPRPEVSDADFALKDQVIDLIESLSSLGNGRVELLEVKHGLPFRALIAEPAI